MFSHISLHLSFSPLLKRGKRRNDKARDMQMSIIDSAICYFSDNRIQTTCNVHTHETFQFRDKYMVLEV